MKTKVQPNSVKETGYLKRETKKVKIGLVFLFPHNQIFTSEEKNNNEEVLDIADFFFFYLKILANPRFRKKSFSGKA